MYIVLSPGPKIGFWIYLHVANSSLYIQISTTKVDFRLRYKKPEELLRDEARGIYPPRFVFNLCRKQYCTHLTVEFVINLKKGKKNHGKFKGNIFIENKGTYSNNVKLYSYVHFVCNICCVFLCTINY